MLSMGMDGGLETSQPIGPVLYEGADSNRKQDAVYLIIPKLSAFVSYPLLQASTPKK